ncbi:MAG: hypothetical protein VKJ64_11580 [Leptolyngbyaceae bacterium]|nr:hypothetical protein [Leptolyngbyaceae bacterium]
MFQPDDSGANASSVSVANVSASPSTCRQPQYESVRHMVFGSATAVQHTIKLLYRLNYAEPNDWSKLVPTGQPNEVVAVLTKTVRR